MQKLIEVSAAKEFASTFLADPILKMAVNAVLDNAPTTDAVEVVHGRWDIDEFGVFCTVCKEYAEDDRRTTCCPECGAKMDGDGNG